MIIGEVNRYREAVICISVLAPNGQLHQLEAIIDTGFDGWLSLPPDFVTMIKLPWQKIGRAVLADGSVHLFDVYEASILWDDQTLTIPIDEADSEPLVGMALMHGFDLSIRNLPGGRVTIEKI